VIAGAHSLGVDAQALALLDDLLDLPEDARAAHLARLETTAPEVHARLVRLLKASAAVDDSTFLEGAGAAAWQGSEWREGPALRADEMLGPYRLIRELGQGGMSVVWLAERADGLAKRRVAVKLPWVGPASSSLAERFTREQGVLAGLVHPHIARLYDAGTLPSGQPFIVLELVEGLPITDYCDAHALSVADRLRVFRQVLAAVDHAHRHLVVHRDLKPSNILVDRGGQVKLLDFGIAKLLDDDARGRTALTQAAGCALTPQYAAPEQVSNGAVSTATDVYALGVVLHELLTGRWPYAQSGGSAFAIGHAVLTAEPTAPSRAKLDDAAAARRSLRDARQLRACLRGDLDTIVLKALRKAPDERYGAVERLGDDLARYLARQPITARRASVAHRLKLFASRHRAASTASALGVAAALALAAVALQQHRESRLQEARATAVSGFLSDLVSDAEADETRPAGEVTGKEMIDAAVARAQREFGDRPQLEGELLGELGRMYFRLGEHAKSVRTLSRAVALLEARAAPADPALNKARAHLSNQLFQDGDVSRSEALAKQALTSCTTRDADCAKARGYATEALGMIESSRGRLDAALAYARQTVREMEEGFGAEDVNTVDALESLAVIARNGGHLQEAGDALDRALSLGGRNLLGAADRTRLQRTQALLELDLGHFDAARAHLSTLAQRTADARERAVQLRLLSTALAALGDAPAALAAAEDALALSDPHSAQPNAVFSSQAHARALSLLGRHEDALREMRAVVARLTDMDYAADSFEVLRAQRMLGEMAARAGDLAQARGELEASLAALKQRARAGDGVEIAQALELLGCLARATGDPRHAAELHGQARAWLERLLPPDHPWLDRNALYQAMADAAQAARSGDGNARRQAIADKARVYAGRFPPGSLWRRELERGLDTSACAIPATAAAQATAACRLIL
jgi:serine/threonine-protein kinase